MRNLLSQKRRLSRESGLATLEVIPLIFVFVFLMAYTLGAFGVIHTGIKQSISARAYAFETFRGRSNLVYFRDTSWGDFLQYKDFGNRVHGILSDAGDRGDDSFNATERPIRIGIELPADGSRNQPQVHNQKVHDSANIAAGKRNTKVEVSPVWVMVQYGICLNVKCGD